MPKLDPLTGLLDGQNLERRLDELLDRADESGAAVSVVIADLGGLKQVNEKYGRQAGDLVLRTVGQTFADNVREPDYAYRLGGDAFVFLYPGVDAEEAADRARRLQEAVAATIVLTNSGERIPVSATVGVACYPADGRSSRSLVRAADRRMHAMKGTAFAG